MRKENGNGGANQWLASGEQRVVSPLAEGKEMAKGENLGPRNAFVGEGTTVVPHIDDRMPAA
jgi:hypothetical protein